LLSATRQHKKQHHQLHSWRGEQHTRITRAHLGALQAGYQRVNQMSSLLVSNLWQPLLGRNKQLSLIHASKLRVYIEIMLVQNLQHRVKQTTQRRVA
jgi:hypothetical protein